MTERDRDNSGRFTSDTKYSADEFLTAITEEQYPTTTDIAEAVNCSRSTARNWLNELKSNGDVTSEQIGNAVVWKLN